MSRFAITFFALPATFGAAFAAQQWPVRPIAFVVPYGPDGKPDMMARPLADALSPRLGQPAIVENHRGADGSVGVDAAAAEPDGYTLLLGTIDTQAILGRVDNVIAASPHLGVAPFGQLTNRFGLLTPAGTPPRVVTRLGGRVAEIEEDDADRKRMEADRVEPINSAPQEFGTLIQSGYTRFGEVIEHANVVVN